jgi:sporulation protein YlmC with PRC-barrel domain
MLLLASQLNNLPILSIRVGGRIGKVLQPIINPNNLHIDGFYVQPSNRKERLIVLDMNIRDFSGKGIIVDDHTSLSEPEELVRLQSIIEIDYSLIGKAVLVNKRKVGKVRDFSIDTSSLFVQKMYVQPPLWKNVAVNELIFDCKNIVEVTDKYIAFRGPEVRVKDKKFSTSALQANLSASASTISE